MQHSTESVTVARAVAPTGPTAAIDRWQLRHRVVGFVVATFRSYGAARGGDSVSLIAYRSFLSVFPLLIALTTIADRVLATRPDLRNRLLSSTASSVPLLGDQLRAEAVTGSIITIVAGLSFALWSGLSAVLTMQGALADQWRVPKSERASFVVARLRASATLLIVVGALVVSSIVSSIGLGRGIGGALLGLTLASLVNTLSVFGVFHVLVPGRRHLWGAGVAGVLLAVVQLLGAGLVSRSLVGASATYGTFATVVALTAWFSLNAQIVVLSTSVNCVKQRVWFPTSLAEPGPWQDAT